MNFRDTIDAVSEREALAIEQLAEILDIPIVRTRLQIRREEVMVAKALGRADVKHPAYARNASRRAHAKITDDNRKLLVWGPQKKYPRHDDDTARIAKFHCRLLKLQALSTVPASRWIKIAEAARLSAIGARTLQRACLAGTVAVHRDFTATATNGVGDRGRYLIQVRDVRRLLELKLSGRAITAA